MKRYLFSAVGTTDPIKNQRDGAILHIIRRYKPNYACLYMTKEIVEYKNKDKEANGGLDRYTYSFNKIKESLNINLEIEYIEDNKLVDPSKMNVFYKLFLSKIKEIENKAREESDDYEILLNVSSGTPAQKSTLQLIATLGNSHYKAIQVVNPKRKADNEGTYGDIELVWNENKDNNKEEFVDRCSESIAEDFIGLAVLKENIKLLIKNYDYSSVYDILNNMNSDVHLKGMIRLAMNRLDINPSEVREQFNDNEKEIFGLNVINDVNKNSIEYLLTLNVRINKKQYIDFIRGITPIGFYLIDKFYKEKYSDELHLISANRNKKGRIIKVINTKEIMNNETLIELREFLKKEWSGDVKDVPFTFDTYYRLVKYHFIYKQDIERNFYQLVERLSKVEDEVRNLVAHQIEYMTRDRIKEITDLYPEEIYEKLVELARYCGLELTEEILSSYERMNDYIIEYIDNNFHNAKM